MILLAEHNPHWHSQFAAKGPPVAPGAGRTAGPALEGPELVAPTGDRRPTEVPARRSARSQGKAFGDRTARARQTIRSTMGA